MGGFGSGTWSRWYIKPKVESFLALSAANLYRWGYLSSESKWFGVSWSRDGNETGGIRGFGGKDTITLVYTHGGSTNDREVMNYQIQIEWTSCNYGGERPWFRCPKCSKRVGKLYAGQMFLCRACRGCVYRCQSQDQVSRAINRQDKLCGKLQRYADGHYYRPKGMHWKTYNRIMDKFDQTENEACDGIAKMFDRFNSQAGRS